MAVTRRDFIRTTGAVVGGAVAAGGTFSACGRQKDKLAGATTTVTVCPGCDMGCGVRISTRNGNIVNVDGDPLHPINNGSICSRGTALAHMISGRQDTVLHRKPGSGEWENMTWDDAIARIATLVGETRDRTFIPADKSGTINTCRGIAALTGGFLSNEEYYLWGKLLRILGITAMAGLAGGDLAAAKGLESSFGLDGMTNPWNDIANADVILVAGADPAESHPVSIAHVQRARDRGCRVVTVDPRFTRTSAISDYHVSIRPGTDAAFFLGVISSLLSSGRVSRDYLVEYTNATFLVDPSYACNGGVFSGFRYGDKSYDTSSWRYITDEKGIPRRDRTLKDERCVYRNLVRLVSSYTPEIVSGITGCSQADIASVADIMAITADPRRAGAIIAGGGLSEQVTGTQSIRALGIIQLLLGNMGQRGGGIAILNRGANSQGMRDQGMTWSSLPGALDMPWKGADEELDQYRHNHIPKSNDPLSANENQRNGRYMVSLLKAWFGDRATADNDYLYRFLPRLEKPLPATRIIEDMASGSYGGAFLLCADPLLSMPRQDVTLKALDKLSWLVCADFRANQSSSWWKRDGVKSETIQTEVFLLPVASPLEVSGSLTNSARLVQWRTQPVMAPGRVLPGLEVANRLFSAIRGRYAKGGVFPDPVMFTRWEYGEDGGCDPEAVAREINGYDTLTGRQLRDTTLIRDDGTTACGNRLYCGSYPGRKNAMASRVIKKKEDRDLYPGWGWSWPANTRILYNRASVDSRGKPWSGDKPFMTWDGNTWSGDVADGSYPPGSRYPFTYLPEGAGRIFSPVVFDGPFPYHYEPPEGPSGNFMRDVKVHPLIPATAGAGRMFPCVVTLYGGDENLSPVRSPWLDERMVSPVCEISPDLAKRRNLVRGDKVRVTSSRGSIVAAVIISPRVRPLVLGGTTTDVIILGGACGAALAIANPLILQGTIRSFMGEIVKVQEGSNV